MRLSSPALAFVVLVGCAPTLKNTSTSTGDKPATGAGLSPGMASAMAEAQNMAAMAQAARADAEGVCAPLLRRQISWEEERTIGTLLATNLMAREGHLYLEGAVEKDPTKLNDAKAATLPEGGKNAVSAHVAIVGRNLAHFSSRPDVPWVFGVIENDAPNASSTAGGYVFVTTGLLKKMTNEAQLAGVLAHEIAHVVNRHSLAKYVDARHKQCIAAKYAAYLIEHGTRGSPPLDEMARYARNFDNLDAPDADFARFIMKVLLMFAQFGNDPQAEFETDKTALQLVSFAGYDAAEYEKFLTSQADQAQHPKSADRVAKLKALRQGELMHFATGTAKPDLGKVFAPLGK